MTDLPRSMLKTETSWNHTAGTKIDEAHSDGIASGSTKRPTNRQTMIRSSLMCPMAYKYYDTSANPDREAPT